MLYRLVEETRSKKVGFHTGDEEVCPEYSSWVLRIVKNSELMTGTPVALERMFCSRIETGEGEAKNFKR